MLLRLLLIVALAQPALGAFRAPVVSGKSAPLQVPGAAPGHSFSSPLNAQLAAVNQLRLGTSLPALTLPETQQLSQAPASTVRDFEVFAAQQFLREINPSYDPQSAQQAGVESEALALLRQRVVYAREIVRRDRDRQRQEVHVDAVTRMIRDQQTGHIAIEKLDAFFSGTNAHDREALRLIENSSLSDHHQSIARGHILDGDYTSARRELLRLQPTLEKNAAQGRPNPAARINALLAERPDSTMVRGLRGRLQRITDALKKRRYGDVLIGFEDLNADMRDMPLSEHTWRSLGYEGVALSGKARRRGARSLYQGRGLSVRKLHLKVEGIRDNNPADYVGDRLVAKATRLQLCGDCKIQQTYNHTRMSLVAEQIPYSTFLRAMEHKLQRDFRSEGMHDSPSLYNDFGLESQSLRKPHDGDTLVQYLQEHGALITSILFDVAGSKKGRTDHAVLIQGAFREEGVWKFIVIDSNHSQPRVHEFKELLIFGADNFHALRPKAEWSEASMRADVKKFYEKYALRRPVRDNAFRSFGYWLLNLARTLLRLEPLEIPIRWEIDRNAVLVSELTGRLRRRLTAYQANGNQLPDEAILTDKDGQRYYNKTVLERVL
jgi:hypothetical protein